MLDVGCGDTPFAPFLASHCKDVHCVDKKAIGLPNEKITFRQCDMIKMPYPDNYFDRVFCISVLEHIEGPLMRYINEMLRVLKVGGLLILTVDVNRWPTQFRFQHPEIVKLCQDLNVELPPQPLDILRSEDHSEGKIAGEGLSIMGFTLRKVKEKSFSPLSENRVLIASCIRQGPEILREFLESLDRLKKPKGYGYLFIPNNLSKAAERVLHEWSKGKPVDLIEKNYQQEYMITEVEHKWTYELVSNVIEMKNLVLEEAKKRGVDYLLLLDSDNYLHPETLNQLLSREKDIVSEICWTRWRPSDPELPNAWFFGNYGFPSDGLLRLRQKGLVKVGGMGGLYLISKRALIKGISFARVSSLSPECQGEDRHFAVRAQSLGFDLWVDTKHPSFHIYRLVDLKRLEKWKANDFKELPLAPQRNKVLIAIINTGTIRTETCAWLVNTLMNHPEYGLDLTQGHPIDATRNTVVKKFLTLPEAQKYEWLLFVDSDIVPPIGAVDKLLSRGEKVIGAVCYALHGATPFPVMLRKLEPGQPGWGIKPGRIRAEGIREVDVTGASYLLIHREVLERIGKDHFRFGYDDWGMVTVVGEDFDFCQKARAAGYKTYVDLEVQCEHYKTIGLLALNRLLEGMAREGGKEIMGGEPQKSIIEKEVPVLTIDIPASQPIQEASRLPIDILKEIARDTKRQLDLPNVWVGGSQSPNYHREPSTGDIDFFSYPPDYKQRRKHYERVSRRYQLKSEHPALDGKYVDVIAFDREDPLYDKMMLHGHSVRWWERFNIKLA